MKYIISCVFLLVFSVRADFSDVYVDEVESQPLLLQCERLIKALDAAGFPLSNDKKKKFLGLKDLKENQIAGGIQKLFDPLCITGVNINPESRVKVVTGPAGKELVEGGWSAFLVKVKNQAGVTAPLAVKSRQSDNVYLTRWDWNQNKSLEPRDEKKENAFVRERWLGMEMSAARPLNPKLSGLNLEYRIILLYSRDKGKRAAEIAFDVGQGTQDIGFRNDIMITFNCIPATSVTLEVYDEKGEPSTGAFVIRDKNGRVFPATAKRLAPDFFFHAQVYRSHGEKISLPPGKYSVKFTRGPESVMERRIITVDSEPSVEKFQVKRWVDPSLSGYWSGDHHIHAAGCKHYTNPTIGVGSQDMFRHIHGEDLKIGSTLTWGPGFDHQMKNFTGKEDKVSKHPYMIRYDVEVSGFGSHRSGHLCLLRLKTQLPPGGNSKRHWPTLGLNTLKWAQKQGAVCGPAHSGWGLGTGGSKSAAPGSLPNKVPNYIIPPLNGIGANEYIVDVTHKVPGPDGSLVPAVDFLSTCDTPWPSELNIWYHTLNCGYKTRVSGETDFPCIFDERVGLGRSYVYLEGKPDYDKWCEGISKGTGYVSDGLSHLMDFKVNGIRTGSGEVKTGSGKLTVTAKVAARLEDWALGENEWQLGEFGMPDQQESRRIRDLSPYVKPYWHIERARIGKSKKINLELVVNGIAVDKKEIIANGSQQDVSFEVNVSKSSWVALRILGSSHTNPHFVLVGGEPIRASKKSAEWCLKCVEKCWQEKKKTYAQSELKDAEAAYEHARNEYRKILKEAAE